VKDWIIDNIGLLTHLGIYALVMYMIFIIAMICRESSVPRDGAMWLFIVLGAGFTGWIAKDIISLFL
jgi:hypothetical protein